MKIFNICNTRLQTVYSVTLIKKLTLLLLLIMLIPLGACDKSTTDDKKDNYNLEGSWINCSSCIGYGYVTMVTLTFSKKTKTYTQIISMNNPDNPAESWYDIKKTSTYQTGDILEISDIYGTIYPKEIDFTLDSIIVTPTSEIGALVMNDPENLFMGMSGWIANVEKNVTGIETSMSQGVMEYDIFWIDVVNNTLYLGDSSTGDKTSPTTRPTNLASEPYIKQESK